jgi:hypothetical protein
MEVGFPQVEASLQFFHENGAIPVALVPPGSHVEEVKNAVLVDVKVAVHDGRVRADAFDVHKHGFQLLTQLSGVKNFFDAEEVEKVYYAEVEALVKVVTGAKTVLAFDYTIRIDDPVRQKQLDTRSPAACMHNDFTSQSARQRVKDLLGEEYLEARYGSINVWRPLVERVETRPLVFGNAQTLETEDFVPAERHYLDEHGAVVRIGGVYNVRPRDGQQWFYFHAMTHQEVVLLKCFDSQPEAGQVRWTAHGSMEQPQQKPDAVPRESIEVRTLYVY